MKDIDLKLKEMAQAEGSALPQWAHRCIEDALGSLPKRRKKRRATLKIFGTAVAAALLVLIALPNLSVQAAERLHQLPVIGPLFRVVTFRTYVEDDPYHPAQAEVPQVELPQEENPQLQPAVDAVNTDIQALTDQVIARFQQDAGAIGDQGHTSMSIRSQVITDTERWFSLALEVQENGSTYYRYYHIDKTTGEIVRLSDLFASREYVEAISGEIQSQMRERGSELYWVDSPYEGLNFTAIDPDQNFYFAENGDIVIAFDKYEVAPGSTGCPTFQIPRSVYAAYLKECYK